MSQELDPPGKKLSVLRGGKKEPAAETAGTRGSSEDKTRGDSTAGDAKVSSLIHGLALHMFKKTPAFGVFPYKLHVLRDEEGEAFILEEGECGEVRRISNGLVSQYILKFIADQGFPMGTSKITADHMRSIITEFTARAPLCPEPAMVLQKSEPGLTYRKLPFDFESDQDLDRSPTFKEMMKRTSNAPALMAWIGSLFDPAADMQQYVWIYGAGRNGKSALGGFLGDVLGSGARFVRAPKQENRFWTLQLIGKRLVIYSDNSKADFVTDDLFKSMTGGDVIPAEIKGGATLNVKLKGKHLFFSNTKPRIDSGEADQRRIILCEMDPIVGDPDPFYQERLWSEAASFLGECINVYCELGGPKRVILCKQDAALELAHENHEFYDSVFHQCFVVDSEGEIPAHQFISSLEAFKIKSGPDIARFRIFAEKQYDVRRERISGAGFLYRGIRRQVAAALTK